MEATSTVVNHWLASLMSALKLEFVHRDFHSCRLVELSNMDFSPGYQSDIIFGKVCALHIRGSRMCPGVGKCAYTLHLTVYRVSGAQRTTKVWCKFWWYEVIYLIIVVYQLWLVKNIKWSKSVLSPLSERWWLYLPLPCLAWYAALNYVTWKQMAWPLQKLIKTYGDLWIIAVLHACTTLNQVTEEPHLAMSFTVGFNKEFEEIIPFSGL